ncbi:MAG: hypothetical protein NTX50_07655 [Candidatus Sumerlaeota bacterium]|nr:hypothetical protein [Candidatus Sumerlaeota bacterium]
MEESDIGQYPLWVMGRVLDYGDLPDVHALIQFYERDVFLPIAAQVRFTTPRAENFWRQILEQENIPCTKRSFPQEANLFWKR